MELDVERVVCRVSELSADARGFTIGSGDWPLRGFVVKAGDTLCGYVNRCPHAGHALDLRPQHFLTPDRALILCASHGAMFEKLNGYCVAGPCVGRSLTPIPLVVKCGLVLLADDVDVDALANAVP